MKKDIPRNEAGEPPTTTPEETEERLEEKARQDHGRANRDRIEATLSKQKR
ncbi:MAG TPA: hypothetical protein VF998_11935 [Candidatus Limnocylindria bacterium]